MTSPRMPRLLLAFGAAWALGTPLSLAQEARARPALPAAPAPQLPTGYTPAPDEDAGRVIVLNKGAHTADVVDVASGQILKTLQTGVGPHEVAVHPEGRFAVVADYGENEPGSSLTVLDLKTLEAVGKVDLGSPIRPHGLVFEPNGRHLWVSAETVRQVWRVAFPSGEVVAKVDSQATATHMVALAADGRVVTANIGSGSSSVVGADPDTGAYSLLAQIPTGAGAEGVCVNPVDGSIWVSNRAEDSVSVIDGRTLQVVAELPCAGFPIRAEASADGRLVLVSSAMAGELTLFDALAREELARIPMPFQVGTEGDALLGQMGESSIPIGIAVHPSGKLAFVANAAVDRIAVVDLIRRKVVAQLPTGRGPDGIAWVPTPTAR